MNLFKSQHSGVVNADNQKVSLYLTALFNSNDIVGTYVLLEIIKVIDVEEGRTLSNLLNLSESIRVGIPDFNNRFLIKAELFEANELENFIDVSIYKKSSQEKVVLNLVLDNNLSNHFITDIYTKLLRKKLSVDVPCKTVLLTKDNEGSVEYFKNYSKKIPNTYRLKWSDFELNSNSLLTIFKKLLKLESEGEIAPIPSEELYQIKCFIDYVELEFVFKSHKEDLKDVKEYARCMILDGTCYMIKKYDDNSIRLFDSDDNPLHIKVKPKLREIINDLELPVTLESKTTNQLGKEVIRAILNL